MQAIIKNKNALSKKLNVFSSKKFGEMTSNAMTGECRTRDVYASYNFHSFSVFNRNATAKNVSKQANFRVNNKKQDFPNDKARLAFLTGSSKI